LVSLRKQYYNSCLASGYVAAILVSNVPEKESSSFPYSISIWKAGAFLLTFEMKYYTLLNILRQLQRYKKRMHKSSTQKP